MTAAALTWQAHRWLAIAALGTREDSIAAWREWSARFSLDTIDAESFWILPLLHRKLSFESVAHPDRPRLAGVYKQMRWRNAIALERIHGLLERLQHADCDGAPGPLGSLSLRGGEDAVPLEPFELVVPAAHLETADAELRALGWKPLLSLPEPALRPFLAGVRYLHPETVAVRLAWRPFGLDCAPDADDRFWESCAPALPGETFALADAVDRVVMAFQNGSWLQALVVMSRLAGEAPAARVVARARALGIGERWVAACTERGASPIPGVPPALLDAASGRGVLPVPDSSVQLVRLAGRHWRRYRRCRPESRPGSFGAYLFGFYRYVWQAPGLAALLAQGCRRSTARAVRSHPR